MKKTTQNNLEHLKSLHHNYKLSLTVETKIRYLQNYVKMLETEITHLEIKSANGLKIIKKLERFGKIKRFFKCSFDMDNRYKEISSKVSQIMAEIQLKYREIELSKYELTILSELFSNREELKKEYLDYFDIILQNYQPEDLFSQRKIQKFQSQKEIFEVKRNEITFVFEKVKAMKNLIDEVQKLFVQIAYGYQDNVKPNYNIFSDQDVKKIRSLATELIQMITGFAKTDGLQKLKIMSLGEDKLITTFTALSNFQRLFNNLGQHYINYENILTASKIRINDDYKKLLNDSKLIENKINHLYGEKRNWFRKILKLD